MRRWRPGGPATEWCSPSEIRAFALLTTYLTVIVALMIRQLLGTAAAATATAALCAAPAGAEGLTGFTSPSGNIGCYVDADYVRCDIAERSWAPPPPPADCEFNYGQGITIAPGEPTAFVCAGDTALSAGPALQFGQSVEVWPMLCESAPSGVRCLDVTTGAGFTISREKYTMF